MEISITCPSCKSTYSFEEEPQNGRLRFPVQCTNCGTDGTSAANEFIRKSLSGELEQERKRNNVWWKRIGRRRDEEESVTRSDTAPNEPGKVRTGLGIVGACIGGAVGLALWFAVVFYAGWEIGFVAWLVGILAGLGARIFVPNGNFTMASTAALCAFLAIMGGQILAMKTTYEKIVGEIFKTSYDKALVYAKDVAATKSDQELQAVLKKHPSALLTFRDDVNRPGTPRETKLIQLGYSFMTFGNEDEDEVLNSFHEDADPEPLSVKELNRYKTEDVPLLVEFSKGKPSRTEFQGIIQRFPFEETSFNEMVVQSWSPYQLLWLVLGVCSAYKLAYNKSETEDV